MYGRQVHHTFPKAICSSHKHLGVMSGCVIHGWAEGTFERLDQRVQLMHTQ